MLPTHGFPLGRLAGLLSRIDFIGGKTSLEKIEAPDSLPRHLR
jgi:hypothetical protein